MVESLSLRIAQMIKRVEPERTASLEVLKFALIVLLNTMITVIAITVIGALTDSLVETLFGLTSFIILRYFSGGLHMKKAVHCSLISIICIVAAPHIPLTETGVIIVGMISLVLILVFAPSNIEGHARIPKKYHFLLKIVAAVIVCANFFLMSSTIAIVFLVQSSSTIRIKRR